MTTANGDATPQDQAVIRLLWEDHALTGHYERSTTETDTTCICGWSNPPTRGSVRSQWEATDAHLASVLPEGTVTSSCWCSRLAVHAEGTGAWYHADQRFMGHEALTGGPPPQVR